MSDIFHLPYNHGSLLDGLQAGARALGYTTDGFAPGSAYSGRVGNHRRVITFLKAQRSQTIVFTYGSSLFDPSFRHHFLLDLPFYLANRVMLFQGSDLRLSYPSEIEISREKEISLGHTLPETTPGGIIAADEQDRKRARLAKAVRYCDRILAVNPDLVRIDPTNITYMPYPYITQHIPKPPLRPQSTQKINVAHLSTNRVLKGTGLIEDVLSSLPKDRFETRVCVQVTKSKAQQTLEWCDVLVDQIGLGWYGFQAVEALAIGKPVICRLNIEDWEKHIGGTPQESGFINAHHASLREALIELSSNTQQIYELGRRGQEFVKREHDAKRVVESAYGDILRG